MTQQARERTRCRALGWPQIWAVLVSLLSLIIGSQKASATVVPAPVISEGMVLQHDTMAPIFGTGAPGESVSVLFRGSTTNCVADPNGRWQANVPTGGPGGPFSLTIQGTANTLSYILVSVGDVWLCTGQSNMTYPISWQPGPFPYATPNPNVHLFISGQSTSWTPATVAGIQQFSGLGYFFGQILQKNHGIPIGLVEASISGTAIEQWLSPGAQARAGYPNPVGGDLYARLVVPLQPFAVCGAIWYQGEANAKEPTTTDGENPSYEALLPALIASWRSDWGQGNFPFLMVQLARIDSPGPAMQGWPGVRQAQLDAWLNTPNTGLAVTFDITDGSLHPLNKPGIAERLDLIAEALVYGVQGTEYSGPVIQAAESTPDKIILSFAHADGLNCQGPLLRDFEVSSAGAPYLPVPAVIEGTHVVLGISGLAPPYQVRYAWRNYPQGNLFNSAGLPASPFYLTADQVVDSGIPGAQTGLEGLEPFATLSGHVFIDANNNGTMDAGESSVDGATVYLSYGPDAPSDGSNPGAVTDNSGAFTFQAPPGTLNLCRSPPSGIQQVALQLPPLTVAAGDGITDLNIADLPMDAPRLICANVWDTVAQGVTQDTLSVQQPEIGGVPALPYSLTPARSDGSALSGPFPLGTTVVTWTLADANGFISICSQDVTVAVTLGPPQALTAQCLVDQQVHLSWSAVTGATSYSVLRSTSSTSPFSPLVSGLSQTSYDDPGLSDGATVYYEVVAVNDNGPGGASDPTSVVVGVPPAVPQNLTAVTSVGAAVDGATLPLATLQWSAAAGAASYNVLRGFSPLGPFTPVATGLTSLSWTDVALSPLTYTVYEIEAVSPGGLATVSQPTGVCFGITRLVVTVSPPIPVAGSTAQITIAVVGPDNATSMTGQIEIWDGPNPVNSGMLNADTTVTLSVPLSLAGSHPITVIYSGDAFFSPAIASFTMGVTPPPPTDLTVTTLPGSALVQWSAVPGAGAYSLRFATQPQGPFRMVGGASISTARTMIALDNRTAYYFTVASQDRYGEGPQSAPVIRLPLVLSSPVGLTTAFLDQAVDLSWQPVLGSGAYYVYRSRSLAGPFIRIGTAFVTHYVQAALTPGVPFYFRVSAVNRFGESRPSAIISVVPLRRLLSPTGVTATPANQAVTLTWQPVIGADSYIVSRASSSAGPFSPVAIGLTASSYTDTGGLNGVSYFYTVAGVNGVGQGMPSVVVSATPLIPPASAPAVTLDICAGSLRLRWTAVPGATAYRVKRSGISGGPYTALVTTTSLSWISGYGLAGGPWRYVVYGVNVAGEGPASAEVVSPLPM